MTGKKPVDSNPCVAASFLIPDESGNGVTRHDFAGAVDTWQADRLSGVEEAVRRVETAQRQGQYVAGVIRYEAGPVFDPAIKSNRLSTEPLVWFASFDKPIDVTAADTVCTIDKPRLRISHADYTRCVHTALEHIHAGNIYQVNYTVRADLRLAGEPYVIWRMLCDAAPAPHAAFIDTGTAQIISLSPELFLRKRGSLLETQPMKGTAARKPSWCEDEQARVALEQSAKNRAENIMIVDLMRNDLSRICRADSVHVAELCRAYRFPTVHQMTSTVCGELQPEVSLFDILKATFPPGSVTGAPKIRATEIIRELEPEPRGLYCGSLCLFLPNGDFTCNVAIRTLESCAVPQYEHESETEQGHCRFVLGIGSAIVADSDPDSEWQETLVKARFSQAKVETFRLFETFRFVPGLGFRNLHSHLMRLKHSCDYFSRSFPLRRMLHALRDLKPALGDAPHRVRLELSRAGMVTLHLIDENLSWPAAGVTLLLSDTRLDPDDPRLYHKTTDRAEKYAALKHAKSCGAHELLFMNSRGELCEGAISNIMLYINGEWLTPALSCGLLPGVWRENQLKSGRAREAILTLDDLQRADKVLVGNSVRGEGQVARIIISPETTISFQ